MGEYMFNLDKGAISAWLKWAENFRENNGRAPHTLDVWEYLYPINRQRFHSDKRHRKARNKEITELKARIAKLEAEKEFWRAG